MSINDDNDDSQYEVGFGKPPRASRFVKGQSGNPKGRPKERQNSATLLKRALNERVSINENGRRKTITKHEAAYKQLVNKAAGGDLRALRALFSLAQYAEQSPAEREEERPLSELDRKVLCEYLKRNGIDNQSEENER